MNRYKVLVLTEPRPGKEAEFNDYYENLHLGEVLATTGWTTAQRFRLAGEAGAGCPLPYLAVYDAEAKSAADVLAVLSETRPQRQQSDTLNKRTAGVWVFEEIGQQHTRQPRKGDGEE